MFYISIGVLQRDAPLTQLHPDIPVTAWTQDQIKRNQEDIKGLSSEVSADIVHTSKVIDFLIDRLPGIQQTEDEQLQKLKELEEENRLAGLEMEESIQQAESLLQDIKDALRMIAEDQFEVNKSL
ncbi:hypothetical protein HDV05_007331 [Chytridiales sp. JEL 0842]|nr:hypothetical protein HDV05_007331 [Chytridiales sp. JEL 0842]